MSLNSGYLNSEADVHEAVNKLSLFIKEIPEYYKTASPEEILHKPQSNKWSKKEILGHLVDSAINNLKRFTEIQFLPQPYKIISYQQVELVTVNDYQHLELDHILNLWKNLNRQIIPVIENIPPEKLMYSVEPYDVYEIKTLAWLIWDYVAHMEHHWRQIKTRIVFN